MSFYDERFSTILIGSKKVTPKPQRHYAKRVMDVECLNPNQKLSYEYDRMFKVLMEDGSFIIVGNDYINGHTKITAGGYLITQPPSSWWFVSQEAFKEAYD